jgi:hypothetical protein
LPDTYLDLIDKEGHAAQLALRSAPIKASAIAFQQTCELDSDSDVTPFITDSGTQLASNINGIDSSTETITTVTTKTGEAQTDLTQDVRDLKSWRTKIQAWVCFVFLIALSALLRALRACVDRRHDGVGPV